MTPTAATVPEFLGAPPDPLLLAKQRQQKTWAAGDYAVVGTTLQCVGESLCEALDLRGNERVLDVAAGNGNASLAAARRWCDVVSTDYVPALLERGRQRALAEQLPIAFRQADAEELPFPSQSFDVVMSVFGVMFTANQARAAAELLRVCRPGGRIGLANWTPDGFVGQLFRTVAAHVPPSPALKPPSLWGVPGWIETTFGTGARELRTRLRQFQFRYRSPDHWLEVFRSSYGPVLKAFESVGPDRQDALADDLLALAARFNSVRDGSMVVPGEYLEVVLVRD